MEELLVICKTTEVMRARLEARFEVIYLDALQEPNAWLSNSEHNIAYVLTDGHLGVPKPIFDVLPDLKVISSYGVGYDAIDVNGALAREIPVTHTPSVLDEEVATTALMLALSCWRNFEAEMANARSGNWAKTGALPLPRSADHRRIGILGLGRIGKAIARKFAPFQPEIFYHGRTKQDVPYTYCDTLLEMANACDTLISVVPGGAATDKLIDTSIMDALGPEGTLINVGRGSTVDEDALIEALKSGRLGWAGLDVFEREPHIPEALRALPNTILTPHIGSATVETRRAMGDLAIDNLIAHLEGKDLLTPVPECRSLLD